MSRAPPVNESNSNYNTNQASSGSNSNYNTNQASSGSNSNSNQAGTQRGPYQTRALVRAAPRVPTINIAGKKNRAIKWFKEIAKNSPNEAHRVLGGVFGTASGQRKTFAPTHNWKRAQPKNFGNINSAGVNKIVRYWIAHGAPLAATQAPGPSRFSRVLGGGKNMAYAAAITATKGLAGRVGGEGARKFANWALNNSRFPNKWIALKKSAWNTRNFLRAFADANAVLGRNVTRKILAAASLSGNNASNLKALDRFGNSLNLYQKKKLSPKKFEDAIHVLGAHMLGFTNMNSPREIAQVLEILKSLYKIHSKLGPPPDPRYSQGLAKRLVQLMTSLFMKYIKRPAPPTKYGPHLNRLKNFKIALAKNAVAEGVFTASKLKKLSDNNAELLRNLVKLGARSVNDPRYAKNLASYSAILGGAGGVSGAALTGAGMPITGAAAAAIISPSIGRIAKLLYQLTPEGTLPAGARATGKAILSGATASNAARLNWFRTHDAQGHLKRYFNMANRTNGSNNEILGVAKLMFSNKNIRSQYVNLQKHLPTQASTWTILKPKEQNLVTKFTELQKRLFTYRRNFGRDARSRVIANYLFKAREPNVNMNSLVNKAWMELKNTGLSRKNLMKPNVMRKLNLSNKEKTFLALLSTKIPV